MWFSLFVQRVRFISTIHLVSEKRNGCHSANGLKNLRLYRGVLPTTLYQSRSSMLKKSLSDQSVAQNKAKSLKHQTQTLRNRGFRFLNRGQKRARRSFSTSCPFSRTSEKTPS